MNTQQPRTLRTGRAGRMLIGFMVIASLLALAPLRAQPGQDDLENLFRALSIDVPSREVTAPPFALPDLNGATVRLADLSGRPVMLYFWTTW